MSSVIQRYYAEEIAAVEEQSRAEGEAKAILNLYKKGILSVQQAAEELKISESAVEELVKNMK